MENVVIFFNEAQFLDIDVIKWRRCRNEKKVNTGIYSNIFSNKYF
jgi:hypothetical protein